MTVEQYLTSQINTACQLLDKPGFAAFIKVMAFIQHKLPIGGRDIQQ